MGVLCDGDMSPSELGTVPDSSELAAGDGAARYPSREQSTAAKATTWPILIPPYPDSLLQVFPEFAEPLY